MDILDRITYGKVIAICRRVYGDELLRLARALLRGGVTLMEVTYDQADPGCIEKTAGCIERLTDAFGDEMAFGAGTVLTLEQALAAAEAGAGYMISPNSDPEIIEFTKRRGLISIPGAMTPTEILRAHKLGADIVKLFPSGYLGFDYIKDILAPISHVKLFATGGVTEENLPRYLGMGFAGAGVSGRLCDRARIADGDFEELTRRARAFADIAARF